MKTKRKVLIGLMALCLAGSVGGVLALTRQQASGTGTTGAFDKAVYLYWGSKQDSVTLGAVENLTANTAQYKYLSVTPESSKTVSGTVTLSFTLAATNATNHLKGLTVSVYETASLADDDHVASLIDGVTPTPVLDEDHLTGTATFSVTATNNAVNVTNKYYAIKVLWTGANDSAHTTYTLGGTVTIAQSFAAA